MADTEQRALTSEGFDVIERRQPSLLLNGSVLITGEVDRTTDFERGMPPAHQCWSNSTWEPDPWYSMIRRSSSTSVEKAYS